MAARQFIYHMRGLSKTYPAGKKVLDNVNLSFYPDAKIGVLGVKSTLMRIMAGLDTEFVGEGFVAEGAKVGYLSSGSQARPNGRRHLISALAPGLFQLASVRRRIACWTMPLIHRATIDKPQPSAISIRRSTGARDGVPVRAPTSCRSRMTKADTAPIPSAPWRCCAGKRRRAARQGLR